MNYTNAFSANYNVLSCSLTALLIKQNKMKVKICTSLNSCCLNNFKRQQKNCDIFEPDTRNSRGPKFIPRFQIGVSFVATVGPFSRPPWFAVNWASVTPLTRYRLISSAMGKQSRYQSAGYSATGTRGIWQSACMTKLQIVQVLLTLFDEYLWNISSNIHIKIIMILSHNNIYLIYKITQ